MKIKILIILISGLLIQSCNSSKEQKDKHFDKNDLDKGNLNGPLKSYKEYSYGTTDKLIDITKSTRYCSFFKIFNNSGNITEQYQYNISGNLDAKFNCIYDQNNHLIEENTEVYFFGIDNRKTIYKYNKNGKLINNKYYTGNQSLELNIEIKTTYNKKGIKIKEVEYNNEGKSNSYKTFEYDTKGNIIEIKWYTEDALGNIENIKYDEYGNEIKSVTNFPLANSEDNRSYKYDSNNNIVEEIFNSSKYKNKDIYTYDYKYDKKENWVIKTSYKNDKIKSITEREYEYTE